MEQPSCDNAAVPGTGEAQGRTGLAVDVRAVEQGGQYALCGTHTAQYQADPVHRGRQEEKERQ